MDRVSFGLLELLLHSLKQWEIVKPESKVPKSKVPKSKVPKSRPKGLGLTLKSHGPPTPPTHP